MESAAEGNLQRLGNYFLTSILTDSNNANRCVHFACCVGSPPLGTYRYNIFPISSLTYLPTAIARPLAAYNIRIERVADSPSYYSARNVRTFPRGMLVRLGWEGLHEISRCVCFSIGVN